MKPLKKSNSLIGKIGGVHLKSSSQNSRELANREITTIDQLPRTPQMNTTDIT